MSSPQNSQRLLQNAYTHTFTFNVQVDQLDGLQHMHIPPGQQYQSPGQAYVEGDASSASYFLAGMALSAGLMAHMCCHYISYIALLLDHDSILCDARTLSSCSGDHLLEDSLDVFTSLGWQLLGYV